MTDPTLATLLENLAKWVDVLDPFGEAATTSLRIRKLAEDAATPWPLLLVAHKETCFDRHGDLVSEGFFETRTCDDAIELVRWLAELEISHEFRRDDWHNSIEFYRLAKRPRMIDGVDEDGLSSDEMGHIHRRVDEEVERRTGAARRAAEVKAAERRVAAAKKAEARERETLAELLAKYGPAAGRVK